MTGVAAGAAMGCVLPLQAATNRSDDNAVHEISVFMLAI